MKTPATFLVCALALLGSSLDAQVYFNSTTGSSYLLTSQPGTVFQARAEAASLGGYLVSINDVAEEQFLLQSFAIDNWWIGLSDEQQEGVFVWDSGEPVTYTNWCTPEPNNSTVCGPGGEDFVQFAAAWCGGWNDIQADPTCASNPLVRGIIEIPGTCPLGANTSLAFDGSNDWVFVPNHPALDGFNDFAVEAWILTTSTQRGLILAKSEDGNGHIGDSYSFSFSRPTDPTGVVNFAIYTGNTSSASVTSVTPVNDGAWHHVAASRIGSALSLYIDGALEDSATFGTSINSVFNPLCIGTLADPNGQPTQGHHFQGIIDEVRIWNVGRSHADILSTSLWSLAGDEPGLVALYDMQTGSGQVVVDKTGNGHNGTLGGSTSVASDDPSWSPAGPQIACVPTIVGFGQPNSANSRLEVDGIDSGLSPGPFAAPVQRGLNFTLDFYGAPNSFFEMYGSVVLNPSGWDFGGFGLFDLGTGPSFNDVFILLPGFQNTFPFYALNASGTAQLSFYVHPSLTPGPVVAIQALIQNAPPFLPDPLTGIPVWATLTATQVLVVQ